MAKSKKDELLKLIKDFGHAMYDAGENTDENDDYYSRQIGKAHRAIGAFVKDLDIKDD